MEKVRNFNAVKERVERAALRLRGQVSTAGEVDGYPLLRLDFGDSRKPNIWIDAGIHGEEPGSVEGLLTWLASHAAAWRERFSFTVFPCLNPHGYERQRRFDGSGADPNRRFREEDAPLVRAVHQALEGRRFAFAIDMHEDCDFEGFYMYEIRRHPPTAYERVLPAVAEVGPICHAAEDPPVEDGLVRRAQSAEEDVEAFFRSRDLWPIAFPLHLHSERSVTLETPGKRPLALRARMQTVAVEACLGLASDM